MAKIANTLLGIFFALALVVGSAEADWINFDSLAPGTKIDDQDLGGVKIYSEGYDTDSNIYTMVIGGENDFGAGYRSPNNAVTNFNYNTYGGHFLTKTPLWIVFDHPVKDFEVTGGDRGIDLDQFSVDFFDINMNKIQTVTTDEFGGNTLDPSVMVDYATVQYSNPSGIKYVKVYNAMIYGIGLDDIRFSPLPEPASLSLLFFGLATLFGLRRKMRGKKK